eukprot:2370875-Rhodomonas_salina.3
MHCRHPQGILSNSRRRETRQHTHTSRFDFFQGHTTRALNRIAESRGTALYSSCQDNLPCKNTCHSNSHIRQEDNYKVRCKVPTLPSMS